MRLLFVVLFCLIGLVFPLAFVLAGLAAWSIWIDWATPANVTPPGYVDHTRLTARDPDWFRHFSERTESPAEAAFLEATVRAFDLVPENGRLVGKDMVMELQAPVPPYRLDFLVDRFLAVEIDGAAWHSAPEAVENDRRRDRVLRSQGYDILRIPAKVTLNNPGEAIARLRSARRELAKKRDEASRRRSETLHKAMDDWRPGNAAHSLGRVLGAAAQATAQTIHRLDDRAQEIHRRQIDAAAKAAEELNQARVAFERVQAEFDKADRARSEAVKAMFARSEEPGVDGEIAALKRAHHAAETRDWQRLNEAIRRYHAAEGTEARPYTPAAPCADDRLWLSQAHEKILYREELGF
ncbi:endonuclease domain-containing protein [Defluviimonas salinarum]|uniref:DUF559 domain-containing protein n=1 Tax=Defluviimonas salinarum TaxID=2992147 RepID=A0ABT3J6B7_9RHOB|nr:DUF559 domain-containing protein [Defluviimonas salinarum]MCW3783226.1 DUF559 domain-containing protein [Defluviimonas salinarum]